MTDYHHCLHLTVDWSEQTVALKKKQEEEKEAAREAEEAAKAEALHKKQEEKEAPKGKRLGAKPRFMNAQTDNDDDDDDDHVFCPSPTEGKSTTSTTSTTTNTTNVANGTNATNPTVIARPAPVQPLPKPEPPRRGRKPAAEGGKKSTTLPWLKDEARAESKANGFARPLGEYVKDGRARTDDEGIMREYADTIKSFFDEGDKFKTSGMFGEFTPEFAFGEEGVFIEPRPLFSTLDKKEHAVLMGVYRRQNHVRIAAFVVGSGAQKQPQPYRRVLESQLADVFLSSLKVAYPKRPSKLHRNTTWMLHQLTYMFSHVHFNLPPAEHPLHPSNIVEEALHPLVVEVIRIPREAQVCMKIKTILFSRLCAIATDTNDDLEVREAAWRALEFPPNGLDPSPDMKKRLEAMATLAAEANCTHPLTCTDPSRPTRTLDGMFDLFSSFCTHGKEADASRDDTVDATLGDAFHAFAIYHAMGSNVRALRLKKEKKKEPRRGGSKFMHQTTKRRKVHRFMSAKADYKDDNEEDSDDSDADADGNLKGFVESVESDYDSDDDEENSDDSDANADGNLKGFVESDYDSDDGARNNTS